MNPIIDFVKILELKRYSRNMVEYYQSQLKFTKPRPIAYSDNQKLTPEN